MSEKKNIDRLFQEKFKDFEAAPPERAWQNIEAELKKEDKERRVIPLWLRLSGVAAILIIGLLLTLPLINNNPDTDVNPVVIEENQQTTPETNSNAMPSGNIPVPAEEAVTSTPASDDVNTPSQNGGSSVSGQGINSVTPSNRLDNKNNSVAYQNDSKREDNRENNSLRNQQRANTELSQQNTNQGVAVKDEIPKRTIITGNNTVTEQRNPESAVVQQNYEGVNSNNDNTEDDKNKSLTPQEKNRILQQTLDRTRITQLAVTENDETPEDTTAVEQENELEKLLKEKENKKEDKELAEAAKPQKWNVRPQVAPVFYNSLSQGSPIDAQFASNSKDYDANLSYGVGVDYAVNDRLTVRTAVNTLKMGYTTNGVEFFPSMTQQTSNVSTPGRAANIVVQDQTGEATAISLFAGNVFDNQKFYGSMVQEMGYIEVPVEMSYKLLNKRFGIDIIGGVSTLFLNENSVFAVSNQGYSTEVGEATNVNNVNFSTNLGIGFRYRFWKSFEANFDPMFKYQVNTFSGESGNFRPYIIGLYSGVSFKF